MSAGTVRRSIITPVVNGEPRAIAAGSTVADLLRELQLEARLVVVEHNRTILRDRTTYAAQPLASGDTIEIVHFVGGG
ncbi:MAG TPA: sulfur carrier protein ThiS [Gemmatimonadaceae bacterium]|nr:sulfur carrier protein ThiS [Gemmatimonadaceae bacterium]HWG51793.1 sulfur carrier protein ThiS [Gemmatimonadaceae bacterium]